MSGHGLHDVKNEVWMKTVIIGAVVIGIGLAAFTILTVGLGTVMHGFWDETIKPYEQAHADYVDAKDEFHLAESRWVNDGSQNTGVFAEDYHQAEKSLEEATEKYEVAEHNKEQAHLSYLTWTVAGKTIMVMTFIYGAFYIIAGFFNSIRPEDHGHDDNGDGYGDHHGSASPILMATGLLFFMMGFQGFVKTTKAMLGIDIAADYVGFAISCAGFIILIIGIGNWWREDLIGAKEQVALGKPFGGQHIRKAGMWVFLISEVMVFASFFSAYLRMRTGWCTQWAVDAGRCKTVDTTTASDLLRHDIMTLLPGAVNTFALIISSYTIVLALKTAKDVDWKPSETKWVRRLLPTRQKAVRNYLIATVLLGSLFIILKIIEWSHLVAEGFDIGTQAGSIFFIATGAHGLHVFIGLLVMLFMIFKADTVGYDEKNGHGIEYFGLYWHFVDLAWVAIFPAFYLY